MGTTQMLLMLGRSGGYNSPVGVNCNGSADFFTQIYRPIIFSFYPFEELYNIGIVEAEKTFECFLMKMHSVEFQRI